MKIDGKLNQKSKRTEAEFKEFEPRLILSRGSNIVGLVPLKIVFNFSRFKPALN